MTTNAVVSHVVEAAVDQVLAAGLAHVALGSPRGEEQAPLTENVLTLASHIG
jgi:hypothetical protein